jgi:hypothetical protein
MDAKQCPIMHVLLYMPYYACHLWNRILCMAAKQDPNALLCVPARTQLHPIHFRDAHDHTLNPKP